MPRGCKDDHSSGGGGKTIRAKGAASKVRLRTPTGKKRQSGDIKELCGAVDGGKLCTHCVLEKGAQ